VERIGGSVDRVVQGYNATHGYAFLARGRIAMRPYRHCFGAGGHGQSDSISNLIRMAMWDFDSASKHI
jgi:hypothetical protein